MQLLKLPTLWLPLSSFSASMTPKRGFFDIIPLELNFNQKDMIKQLQQRHIYQSDHWRLISEAVFDDFLSSLLKFNEIPCLDDSAKCFSFPTFHFSFPFPHLKIYCLSRISLGFSSPVVYPVNCWQKYLLKRGFDQDVSPADKPHSPPFYSIAT